MGKHGRPGGPDTNPIRGLIRKTEPRHKGDGQEDPVPPHTVPPIERTDAGEPIHPFLAPENEAAEYIRFGATFEPDPDSPPVFATEDEDVRRWPMALGVSALLCVVLLSGWIGRATASSEPVRDVYSPVQVATVTATPKPVKPRPVPTVTKWRTRTPAPRVSRVPVPGPTVFATRTITPKPVISKVPVPGPTKTVYRECVITIDRTGVEHFSGDCP